MKLIDDELKRSIPKLREQEGLGYGMVAHVKLFSPWGRNTWFVCELEGDTCFGWGLTGSSFDGELGYFSLEELEGVRG